ncbi:MAG: hypothetical protein Q8T11_02015 [Elusimicrobiota bacterium]|nr:hypothetical protein [Elusimicrobiota bacterium]
MKSMLIASLLAVTAAAAEAPKLLAPNEENGIPVNYRMIYLHVPADTAARIEVELAPAGECFDSSIISWSKSMAGAKRVHSLHFDARVSLIDGKKPEGCPRRKINNGGLHTVDLPAEKGGMLAVITYREGEQVRATFGKSFSTEGVSEGLPAGGGAPSRNPTSR